MNILFLSYGATTHTQYGTSHHIHAKHTKTYRKPPYQFPFLFLAYKALLPLRDLHRRPSFPTIPIRSTTHPTPAAAHTKCLTTDQSIFRIQSIFPSHRPRGAQSLQVTQSISARKKKERKGQANSPSYLILVCRRYRPGKKPTTVGKTPWGPKGAHSPRFERHTEKEASLLQICPRRKTPRYAVLTE